MRAKWHLFVALLLLGAMAGGCAYTKDRVNDLIDVAGAKVLAGGGVRAAFGFGPYRSPVSVGWYNLHKYGFEGRAAGHWTESGGDLVIPLEYEIAAHWGNEELGENVDEYYDIVAASENVSSYRTYPLNRYRNYGDAQITFFPGCLGVEVNVSPIQVCDFVLGFVTIDIVRDDHDSREADDEMDDEMEVADAD
ncbi:MAG: hypothetical protein RL885_13320 [Planctomycetota bacterium]